MVTSRVVFVLWSDQTKEVPVKLELAVNVVLSPEQMAAVPVMLTTGVVLTVK